MLCTCETPASLGHTELAWNLLLLGQGLSGSMANPLPTSAMNILHEDSLVATVSAFNEARSSGLPWKSEAKALLAWTDSRLGLPGAYAGTFALTASDWKKPLRLFTGETLTTRAGRSHVMAEETLRMLALIRTDTGLESSAYRTAEQRLETQIFTHPMSSAAKTGLYCCGTCSLSFWRALAAGVYPSRKSVLKKALATLASARDGKGGWKGFSFHYTLLLLSELPRDLVRDELSYCTPRALRAARLLRTKNDSISRHRRRVLQSLGF